MTDTLVVDTDTEQTAARKRRAELLGGREIRTYQIPVVAGDTPEGGIRFDGYGSSTERSYDMGYYQETIAQTAFDRTLNASPDVSLFVNHDGLALARTTNGSLTLDSDDKGLHYLGVADPDDAVARDVRSRIQRGLVDQSSFAFRVTRQEWNEDYTDRRITEVDLNRGDVSIVSYGANPDTPVTARSMFDGLALVSDDELLELAEDPDVVTIIRRLGYEPAKVIPEIVAEGGKLPLDVARARAIALRLRAR